MIPTKASGQEPVGTISILNPTDHDLRIVFGLFESGEDVPRLEIVLLEEQTTIPGTPSDGWMAIVNDYAMRLNEEMSGGEVTENNPKWRTFDDPNGPRIFHNEFVGGLTGYIVKTTLVNTPESLSGLGRVLEMTYGRVKDSGPEVA